MRPEPVEITDLLGGPGIPVRRDEVVERLRDSGQRRAARIAEGLPATPDGLLDRAEVDRLLIQVHRELQRLSEELQQGRRVAETLAPWVARLGGGDRPVRVVDVGCGLGYVVRWLAARRALDGVELVGVDLDAGLVAEAARLAEVEELDCRFVHGDALDPGIVVADPERTLLISTGLLHHLRGDELRRFFAAHEELGVAGFCHWDPDPGWWTILGAWMFHRARMREPVSRHDGVLSARRAHPAEELLRAARAGAPAYEVACGGGSGRLPLLSEVLRPVVGVRR